MSVLDNSITVRDLLRAPLAMPRVEMSLEAYRAIPGGLLKSREINGGSSYRFAYDDRVAGYAVACVATLLKVTSDDEGGTVHYEHKALTVNGGAVILRAIDYRNYRILDPFGSGDISYDN